MQIAIISMALRPATAKLHFLGTIKPTNKKILFSIIESSNSQLYQDIFVLNELNFIRNGFFVEFGALDGIKNSNTFLLESKYGWTGILAEPSKKFFSQLEKKSQIMCLG